MQLYNKKNLNEINERETSYGIAWDNLLIQPKLESR